MKKMIGLVVATLLGCVCLAQTPAEIAEVTRSLEGTLFVAPLQESADGQITACGIEFSALEMDFSTKGGAPVKMLGSFYIRNHPNGRLFYAIKMGIADGLGENPSVSAPANAFIRAPRGKAPVKAKRSAGESADYALFVGAVDSEVLAAYEAIAMQNQLVVGFNRAPGQMDVTTTLDLTVVDTKMVKGKVVRERSLQSVTKFIDCTVVLLKAEKR